LPTKLFDSLGLEAQTTIEPKDILTFEDAKPIFQKGLKSLNKAKEYYLFDGFVTDHFNILQDIGNLYLALIHFEKDPSNKCKMHKRRVDLIETMVNELNPQYFLAILQQITFQLGETYSQMFEIKLKQYEESTANNSSGAAKINAFEQEHQIL